MGSNEEYTIKDAALEMIPIYGTYKSAERFAKNPTWRGAGETALSLVGDIATLTGVGAAVKGLSFANKARNGFKAAQAASRAANVARQKYWDVASTAGKQIAQNKGVITSLTLDNQNLPTKAWNIIRKRMADNQELQKAVDAARRADKDAINAAETAYRNAYDFYNAERSYIQSSAASVLFGVGTQAVEARVTGLGSHENGGPIKPNFIQRLEDRKKFRNFRMTLPKNLRPLSRDYNMRRYWELHGKPDGFYEALTERDGMFSWESDGAFHANTVAPLNEKGEGEFMKSKNHRSLFHEVDWYNKGITYDDNGNPQPLTGEDRKVWENFRKQYDLDTSKRFYKYVPKTK